MRNTTKEISELQYLPGVSQMQSFGSFCNEYRLFMSIVCKNHPKFNINLKKKTPQKIELNNTKCSAVTTLKERLVIPSILAQSRMTVLCIIAVDACGTQRK